MNEQISEAVIRRLPGYYRHLRELEANGIQQISSQELGRRMHQTPSLVRQDINSFGGFGRQGYGYDVKELKDCIGNILNLNEKHRMIILGAGNIGTAVARYRSFSREGFETVAMFDISPERIGQRIGDIPILSMEELEAYLHGHMVDIAVIALPGEDAQSTLERLIACGVRAVWNFAPIDLTHDEKIITIVNVHLSDSLQVLSYKLAHRDDASDDEEHGIQDDLVHGAESYADTVQQKE